MITTGEGVDATIRYYISGTDANLNDPSLRAKALFYMQEGAEKLWTSSPVWWREADSSTGTISLTGGSALGTMPTDFAQMGNHGQIYRVVSSVIQTPALEYAPPDILADIAARNPGQGVPRIYTLEGRSSAGTPKLRVHPTPAATTTLVASHYVKRAPYLIDKPTAVTTADGAAGNPNGTYTYQVTFVTASGETEGGIVSSARTVSSKAISVSAIPVSNLWVVTSRKLYRNAAAATYQRKLVTTIADNLQTTYTDDTLDASLGANVPTPSTATATGMEQFPEDWQRSLIFEYAKAMLAQGQGDVRDTKWLQDWKDEARRLWAELKQGRNQARVMPRYGQTSRIGAGRSIRYRIA